jgi:hypothetical protein
MRTDGLFDFDLFFVGLGKEKKHLFLIASMKWVIISAQDYN